MYTNCTCTIVLGILLAQARPTMPCIRLVLKFNRAHLKFTVYGLKQTCMLTHFRNAVPPVWGSLRLTQIIVTSGAK